MNKIVLNYQTRQEGGNEFKALPYAQSRIMDHLFHPATGVMFDSLKHLKELLFTSKRQRPISVTREI